MSVVSNENWNPNDQVVRGFRITKKLTPNNKVRTDNLPFDFVDYEANKQVPCLLYERNYVACINNLGLFTRAFYESKDCMDAESWLTNCIQNHKAMGIYAKYNPEDMAVQRTSSPVFNIKDLL